MFTDNRMKDNTRLFSKVTIVACFFIVGLSIFLDIINIRLLGDDLWYYTFLRHDYKFFIDQLAVQYIHGSGRLFVHIVLAVILATETLIVPQIANAFILLLTMFYAVKLTTNDFSKFPQLYIASLSLFLIIGNYVIADAYLWLSGSFNYLFPMMLLLMYAYLSKTSAKRLHGICSIVICLFSSITTELNSVLTFGFSLAILFWAIKCRTNLRYYVINTLVSFVGLAFLFASPGMWIRFNSAGDDVNILKRCLISFTAFSQMSWERDGMAIIIMISALVCGICSFKILRNKVLSLISFGVCGGALFNIFGQVYSANLCMLLYIIYTVALIWYCISLFIHQKETMLCLCVAGFIVSAFIICVSGEATYRMLFPCAFFLLLIALRSFALLNMSVNNMIAISCVICLFALANIIYLHSINSENANIWDENQNAIQQYNGDGTLELKNVYEERYFQSAFQEYFRARYLAEFGIDGNTIVKNTEDQYYTLLDEDNNIISTEILRRGESYYIYCRTLCEQLGAEVTWQYGTANILHNGNVYRLKSGAHALITSYIGGKSVKLSAPIRSINDKIFICIDDVNKVFNLKYSVKP